MSTASERVGSKVDGQHSTRMGGRGGILVRSHQESMVLSGIEVGHSFKTRQGSERIVSAASLEPLVRQRGQVSLYIVDPFISFISFPLAPKQGDQRNRSGS
jgi:hypothetical protein